MAGEAIREMLKREPFEAFRIRLSCGDEYVVRHPDLVVVMRSEVFIAAPNSDRRTFIPLLHVAAVETLSNGHAPKSPRRGRR